MSFLEWTLFLGMALGVFFTLVAFVYVCERA
jgi:hypothetical protein